MRGCVLFLCTYVVVCTTHELFDEEVRYGFVLFNSSLIKHLFWTCFSVVLFVYVMEEEKATRDLKK